jgi:hypothetical protein
VDLTKPRAILATAADQRYSRSLAQMLLSVRRVRQERVFKVLVYDLGMEDRTRRELERRFAFAEFRTFDFATCPPFPGDPKRCLSSYAWKPVIVAQLMQTAKMPVVWADSATVVVQPLDPVLEFIRTTGLYTPRAGCGVLKLRTHPDTFRLLKASEAVRAERQVAGAFFGFDPDSPLARSITREWAECCAREACLAPPGSDTDNHRFDQAILSVLVLTKAEPSSLTHDEVDQSSIRPIPYLYTRRKVKEWVPLTADPLLRLYYSVRRWLWLGLFRLLWRSSRLRRLLSTGDLRQMLAPQPVRWVGDFASIQKPVRRSKRPSRPM